MCVHIWDSESEGSGMPIDLRLSGIGSNFRYDGAFGSRRTWRNLLVRRADLTFSKRTHELA